MREGVTRPKTRTPRPTNPISEPEALANVENRARAPSSTPRRLHTALVKLLSRSVGTEAGEISPQAEAG